MDCEICGETIRMDPSKSYFLDDAGEFWNPKKPEEPNKIAHASCGLGEEMEVA